ncbi:hypothetical protein JCM8097_008462 [Rhodosporidiobolus ruineniae]
MSNPQELTPKSLPPPPACLVDSGVITGGAFIKGFDVAAHAGSGFDASFLSLTPLPPSFDAHDNPELLPALHGVPIAHINGDVFVKDSNQPGPFFFGRNQSGSKRLAVVGQPDAFVVAEPTEEVPPPELIGPLLQLVSVD